MYKLIFVFCFLVNLTNAQSFGCKFLPLMLKGSEQHLLKYETFLIYKDSVKIQKDKKGVIKIINNSSLPSKYVDSLTKNLNYHYFFDDSLFHLKNNILVIDTFDFFNNNCTVFNNKNFTIVKNINDVEQNIPFTDTIKIKSIRVHQSKFILAMQHSKSIYEVDFMFQLIGNLPPTLENMFKQYPLYKW